ncbi:MAG: aldehyde ferredoxin oxidoreductase N-terminal domain-containing protein, partial [Desulfobacterales bacterium]
MRGGYVGKMLFVDLTRETFEEKPLTDEMADLFIGGLGLGAKILYDMMKPGVDPLGPDNVIGFVTGPLTATGAMFSGRYTVVCKSPVTQGWNDANSGGHFGPELKKAGYDAVFVTGAAKKPVYIWINDGEVTIKDAAGLWGKDSTETIEALIQETGQSKLRASLIGPSGENQSYLACVMNDHHRAAGRGGAGAVMGSKNLKALAVYGTGKMEIAHPDKLREINLAITKSLKEGPAAGLAKTFGVYGTGVGTSGSALSGDSP